MDQFDSGTSEQLESIPPSAQIGPSRGDVTTGTTALATQGSCGCGCGGPSGGPPGKSYVYALGRIEPRFPRVSVEKEFAQALKVADTRGLTNRHSLQSVLSDRSNRYLVRQLCWVFTIEGLETYLLDPKDAPDLDMLTDALRTNAGPGDIDLVIGERGSLARPDLCNGLVLPLVTLDQVYAFSRDELLASIPRPKPVREKEKDEDRFHASAGEVFDYIMQMADNAGATDDHRALNYLAVRYPAVYSQTAECHARGCALAGIAVRPSRLSGTRKVVDVILSFVDRKTDVSEAYFARVDVSDAFPFLVTKLSPYYER